MCHSHNPDIFGKMSWRGRTHVGVPAVAFTSVTVPPIAPSSAWKNSQTTGQERLYPECYKNSGCENPFWFFTATSASCFNCKYEPNNSGHLWFLRLRQRISVPVLLSHSGYRYRFFKKTDINSICLPEFWKLNSSEWFKLLFHQLIDSSEQEY